MVACLEEPVDGYSTDGESWRAREIEERRMEAVKDVKRMVRKMTYDKDISTLAREMGLSKYTMRTKISQGRFSASQLLQLSYLCGYEIQAVDKCQLILEGVLE